MFFSVFICSCHNVFAAGAAGRTVAGTIIASGNGATDGSSAQTERSTVKEQCIVGEYHNTITADARARRARRGIIIVGSGSNTRAMEPYGGSIEKALGYAATVNKYRSQFDGGINIYCMPIPNAVGNNCPTMASFRVPITIGHRLEHIMPPNSLHVLPVCRSNRCQSMTSTVCATMWGQCTAFLVT